MPRFDPKARGTAWSLTINNPTDDDEENMNQARQKGWKVEGQKEIGANGTEHYQLILKTPQTRGSAVKKTFPRAHIELARDAIALEKYVKKEETRIGELPVSSDKYPSLQKMWDMFAQYIEDKYPKGTYLDWIDTDDEKCLKVFDEFIRRAIRDGYVVETMGVNPQMRSCVKNYCFAIFARSMNRIDEARQRVMDAEEYSDDESAVSPFTPRPTVFVSDDEAEVTLPIA
nr:putative replication associated protein [Crucivirus sp.]